MQPSFQLSHPSRPPLVVHQMGKVASTSVSLSLAKDCQFDVFHTHRLNRASLDVRLQFHSRTNTPVPQVDQAAEFLIKNYLTQGKKILVVSLVREPIARNISAYFENLDLTWGVKEAHIKVPMQQLVDRFVERYDHEIPNKWFDDEVRVPLGLDVYRIPFPHEQGFVFLSNNAASMLVMKHDLDDALKGQALGLLLKTGPITVKRANEGRHKKYGDTYDMFRKSIHLSEDFVSKVLESRYARHFFTSEERDRAFRRWTKGSTS